MTQQNIGTFVINCLYMDCLFINIFLHICQNNPNHLTQLIVCCFEIPMPLKSNDSIPRYLFEVILDFS